VHDQNNEPQSHRKRPVGEIMASNVDREALCNLILAQRGIGALSTESLENAAFMAELIKRDQAYDR
jgi:hypothetical protein